MKKLMLLILALATMPGSLLLAQNVTGTWQGSLQVPQGPTLRLVMKISLEDDRLKAVSYSIDQNPTPIPASAITRDGLTVKMTFSAIGGSYEGKLSGDGNSMNGTWTQGPGSMPLNFARATPETTWTIPEPPPPPKLMPADAHPEFEVATIKPSKEGAGFSFLVGRGGANRLTSTGTSLSFFIQFAYGVHARQIEGGASWLESEKYDLNAKPDQDGIPNVNQLRAMMQKLLADRFGLVFHREKKELSVYAITVTKNGPKLEKSTIGGNLPGFGLGRGNLNIRNSTIAEFAGMLQANVLERPVVDQSGLTERYNFMVKYTPDASQLANLPPGPPGAPPAPPPGDPDAPPDLFAAFQQQLGLRLEATKAPVEVLVIDKIARPSEN
jgi:uncharacterized protein (TIGR03435 family)